jgi:hypothetical protein
MKKIVIIVAVVLTSGLTALSITRNDNKTETVKTSIEKTNLASKVYTANTENLATAD